MGKHSLRRRVAVAVLTAVAGGAALSVLASGALASNAKQLKRDQFANFDSRQSSASQKVLRGRAAKLDADPSAALSSLRESLGNEGFVTLDPLTSTVRMAGRTDAFLTGPSSAAAASVAMGYVSSHAAAFGLSATDLGSMTPVRHYVHSGGTRHLSWVQRASGIPLFGNGLKANVTADGRLINVVGSPVAGLTAPSTSPGINADQAIGAAKADIGKTIVPVDGINQGDT